MVKQLGIKSASIRENLRPILEEDKLLACIHCGLCLEACPTYVVTGNENDGPRGRLYLMRAVGEGRLEETSSAFATHIDRCLGCRACEQVCPAGVEYGQLLEASRALLLESQPKSDLANRILRVVLRKVWLSKSRLRLFFAASRLFRDLGIARFLLKLRLGRLISPRAEFGLALLESSRPIFSQKLTEKSNPSPENVLLFAGCVGAGLFARVNRATERVLRANNLNVSTPAEQVCCGALHAHAGDLEGARKLARKNIEAFDSNAPIITNAGGCGAMLTTYGHLFANDHDLAARAASFSARVRDVSQQLAVSGMRTAPSPTAATVTYDTSCHLLYGQHSGESSERMLRAVIGDNFVALNGSERCCGAAGIYNLMQPEMSQRVLNEKLDHVRESHASVLATGNPGCQMHIGAGACLSGMKLRVCHPIELVDQAYERAGYYEDSRNGK
ncbi:MAG TPA: heterodisulfide reductase-related iron-sulfur binding cluster [Pyrinomonadaceae bacterium]|nr:heterodisulfide reductase-related iron-sulfur binding cluster [Pyrinomonadaceae bacterium]